MYHVYIRTYVGRWVGTIHADSLVQVHTLLISLHALLSQLVLTSTYVRTCVFSRHVHSKVRRYVSASTYDLEHGPVLLSLEV